MQFRLHVSSLRQHLNFVLPIKIDLPVNFRCSFEIETCKFAFAVVCVYGLRACKLKLIQFAASPIKRCVLPVRTFRPVAMATGHLGGVRKCGVFLSPPKGKLDSHKKWDETLNLTSNFRLELLIIEPVSENDLWGMEL